MPTYTIDNATKEGVNICAPTLEKAIEEIPNYITIGFLKTSKIYFHLFCCQNGDVMETGKNTETLEELKDELLSYISVDVEEEDEETLKNMSVEEIATMWEFDVIITTTKIQ